MEKAIREYEGKLDAKHRLTLRGAAFAYYHVSEYTDGRIILEPRVLSEPLRLSENTLAMMDEAVKNIKDGKASAPLDLSEFDA